ncbi:MAG TPA: porin [Paucimonas sp.]|nr:porin [Paucimonas sp.]
MRDVTLSRLLLAASIAGIAAGAQAQSDVTIYGRINVGIVNYSGYGAGGTSVTKENNLSSRIGFKGRESLGGGLHAIYQIETGFSANTGDGTIASREASVGLQGDFGKLRLGYMLTPLDDLHGIAQPGYGSNFLNDNLNGFWANGYSNMFSGGTAGNTACVQVAGTSSNTNSFGFDNRYGNSIRYDSPSMNGMNLATHVALGGVSSCKAYAWSSKLQYNAKGLNAALAYNLHRNVRGIDLNDSIVMLAAGYQINPAFYVGGYYQSVTYDNPGKRQLKQNGFGLVGRHFSGPNTFELGWYRGGAGKGDQTTAFSGIFVGDGTQANMYVLGYRYSLSKRTDLWSQYALMRNGDQAGYDLGGAGKAGAAGTIGQSLRGLGFGIKHDF